jgi:acetyl esterase/lipase
MRQRCVWAYSLLFILSLRIPAPAQQPPARSVAPPAGTKVLRDLAYVPGGHERQKLDLYLPEQDDPRLRPVIVWIHGGGWQNGSKDRCPAISYVTRG